jgi:hypothetical protein
MKKINYETIHRDTEKMQRAFDLAVDEIVEVLSRKKPPTDITRLASNVASTYGKLKSAEVHDKALEIYLTKQGQNIKGLIE